jgi:hypothetical protein
VARASQPSELAEQIELERCVHEVAGAALDGGEREPRDDIALLVLSVPPAPAAPGEQVVLRLPAEPGAIPLAR